MALATKLNKTVRDFIEKQHMFFVATAARDGKVNMSPKGLDSLRIIDDNKIVWLNLSGSGNETAAHLLDTPRMTLMFCAFEGKPWIVRLYGIAKAVYERDAEWPELVKLFPEMAGTRQIFEMTIEFVQGSCGTGVPFMDFTAQRGETELVPYWDDLGGDATKDYWARKNSVSLDGQPTGIFRG